LSATLGAAGRFSAHRDYLKNRLPEDAWLFTQRACGVCTYVHGVASVSALRMPLRSRSRTTRGSSEPSDGRQSFMITRSILPPSWPDWIDIVSALSADPPRPRLWPNVIPNAPVMTSRQPRPGCNLRLKRQLGPFAAVTGVIRPIFDSEEPLVRRAYFSRSGSR